MLKPKRVIIKFLRNSDKLIFKSKKFDITDTIVIAGSPRSGTTWLVEILGTIPAYMHLFEPLNPLLFPESFEVGFRSRTYLPRNIDWPQGEKHMEKILTGRIFSNLPKYRLEPKVFTRRLLGKKLIVKFIMGNRLLPWLAEKFQLRGIFLIIRHPCAVVTSQLNMGFCGYHLNSQPFTGIFPNLENILDEASKIDGLDYALLNRLRRIKTMKEILAAAWCLDNYIPLSLPKPYPWTIVTYEKLAIDGEKEITRLFNGIGIKNIPRAAFRYLRIPSISAPQRESKIGIDPDAQLSKWKKSLSKEQIERILNIVSDFGLDFYTENLEPDYKNIGVKS